jgi:aminopeptidase N
MSFRFLPLVLVLTGLAACSPEPETVVEAPYDPARDYFTFANYDLFTTRHIALDLDVDFEAEQLSGSVTLFISRHDPAARSITLDTRDITVGKAELRNTGEAGFVNASFQLGDRHETLGQPLHIDLPDGFEPGGEFELKVSYRTSPSSTALQWLGPELTSGGEYPFLFSQSQSIHARSWIPLQDTPAVRITYEAVIRTPENLLALMSANNDPLAPRSGEYHFEMPQPIPSYLLAIAVGNVFFSPIGEQTGVYAEPEMLSAATWEFAETQEMLERVEAVYGPYQWGRYDLLILPPSFPFGGMENPRLSFITPSVIAGDRSLTSLIAHELAHSWSGNLVTNRTWRDIWLNEGFTSYLDLRVMEMLYGKERAEEERYISYMDLLNEFTYVAPRMQALAPEMRNADPDESQGGTYYTKGMMLLEHMEKLFGREVFDRFLAAYFSHFSWQSVTTEQFLAYLDEHLLQAHPGVLSMDAVLEWVTEPGLPDYATVQEPATLAAAARAARDFAAGEITAADIPADGWSPHAMVNLVNSLPLHISYEQLNELDQALGLSESSNVTITRAWFVRVAMLRHLDAYDAMEQHLKRHGRTWLISGVYRALAENGIDGDLARDIFEQARGAYHPATVLAIESIFRKAAARASGD